MLWLYQDANAYVTITKPHNSNSNRHNVHDAVIMEEPLRQLSQFMSFFIASFLHPGHTDYFNGHFLDNGTL